MSRAAASLKSPSLLQTLKEGAQIGSTFRPRGLANFLIVPSDPRSRRHRGRLFGLLNHVLLLDSRGRKTRQRKFTLKIRRARAWTFVCWFLLIYAAKLGNNSCSRICLPGSWVTLATVVYQPRQNKTVMRRQRPRLKKRERVRSRRGVRTKKVASFI